MPNPKDLVRDFRTKRVSAAEALELLRAKSLADGVRYYIGFNTRDGWLEIFKTSDEVVERMGKPAARELSAEEIDQHLMEKGLYLFASRGGWVTIRRIPRLDSD